jgi:hypothetical protein
VRTGIFLNLIRKKYDSKKTNFEKSRSATFQKSQSTKTKLLQANLGSLHFKELSCSASQSATKLQSACFTFHANPQPQTMQSQNESAPSQ